MRIVTYGGAVSLDGFLAGADGSIDWLHFSKDVQQVMTDYWKDVDTILMGRKTYEVSVAQNPSSAKKPAKAKKETPSAVRRVILRLNKIANLTAIPLPPRIEVSQ